MTQRPMAMSNQGFFGSIFESPDEDPLLQSDDRTADPSARTDDARTDDRRPEDRREGDPRTDDRRENDWGDDDWMNDDAFSGDGASYGSDATFYDDLYGDTADRTDKRADDAASDDFEETDVQDVHVALDDAQSSLQTLNAAVDDGWRMTHVDLVGSGAFASDPQVVITIERSHPRSLFDFGPGG